MTPQHLHEACDAHNSEEPLRVEEALLGSTLRHEDARSDNSYAEHEPLNSIDGKLPSRQAVIDIVFKFHIVGCFLVVFR